MFDYIKIRTELEQVKCPTHGTQPKVTFTDGKINLENVCCEVHRRKLTEIWPDIEEQELLADIMEDVY